MTVNWAQPLDKMDNRTLIAAFKEVRADGFFPRLAERLRELLVERGIDPISS